MKTRRTFQIILAVMSALAAVAFLTATICVIIPLVTGNKIGFLDQLVDGVRMVFGTYYLSTEQMVTTELLVLVPFVFTVTAAILLFDNHGKQWVYRMCYVLLMLGTFVPGIAMCICCKALYGQRWLMFLFVTIVVIILYVLLPLITWLIKIEDQPTAVTATTDSDAQTTEAQQETQTQDNGDQHEAQTEQNAEDEQAKLYRRKVKQIQILQDLHDEKRIDNDQYIALVNYVMNKKN